jgi:hypothetical protein
VCPAHLATLLEAIADDRFHRRLGGARGDRQAGARTLAVVHQSEAVVAQVGDELAHVREQGAIASGLDRPQPLEAAIGAPVPQAPLGRLGVSQQPGVRLRRGLAQTPQPLQDVLEAHRDVEPVQDDLRRPPCQDGRCPDIGAAIGDDRQRRVDRYAMAVQEAVQLREWVHRLIDDVGTPAAGAFGRDQAASHDAEVAAATAALFDRTGYVLQCWGQHAYRHAMGARGRGGAVVVEASGEGAPIPRQRFSPRAAMQSYALRPYAVLRCAALCGCGAAGGAGSLLAGVLTLNGTKQS